MSGLNSRGHDYVPLQCVPHGMQCCAVQHEHTHLAAMFLAPHLHKHQELPIRMILSLDADYGILRVPVATIVL